MSPKEDEVSATAAPKTAELRFNSHATTCTVDLRESEGRTRAAELLADGLRGDLQVAKDQVAEAEGAAEATTRGAAAQSVAFRL